MSRCGWACCRRDEATALKALATGLLGRVAEIVETRGEAEVCRAPPHPDRSLGRIKHKPLEAGAPLRT